MGGLGGLAPLKIEFLIIEKQTMVYFVCVDKYTKPELDSLIKKLVIGIESGKYYSPEIPIPDALDGFNEDNGVDHIYKYGQIVNLTTYNIDFDKIPCYSRHASIKMVGNTLISQKMERNVRGTDFIWDTVNYTKISPMGNMIVLFTYTSVAKLSGISGLKLIELGESDHNMKNDELLEFAKRFKPDEDEPQVFMFPKNVHKWIFEKAREKYPGPSLKFINYWPSIYSTYRLFSFGFDFKDKKTCELSGLPLFGKVYVCKINFIDTETQTIKNRQLVVNELALPTCEFKKIVTADNVISYQTYPVSALFTREEYLGALFEGHELNYIMANLHNMSTCPRIGGKIYKSLSCAYIILGKSNIGEVMFRPSDKKIKYVIQS